MYNDFLKRNAAVAISGLMALSLAAVLSFAGIACATTCSQPCCKQNALANNEANQPTDKEEAEKPTSLEATACSQPCCKTQLLLVKNAAEEYLQQEIETAVTLEATACSQPCCKTQLLAKNAADEQFPQEAEAVATLDAAACPQPCCKTRLLLTRIRQILDIDKGSEDRSPPVLDNQIGGDYNV